ncbi:hypothetical protein SAMN05216201_11126 [Pseudomonas linyingensis]|uniref:Uncharacterized protein n=1 Tax=Pseudomonas linyingensis TaxID=915471 RepID=A0A1H7A4L0_9PSED|nr:hypothetical protein [Pseudomonas linyingensis]SEJ56972.1 hypothetical protein SAMN05216201_11126 [Pseudomonas linyingensis]
MTAKTQSERSAKTATKRDAAGEVELRHRVRPGVKAALAELMAWHGIEEQAEAIQLLALNAESVQLLPAATEMEPLPLRHRVRPGLIAKLDELAGGAPIGLVVESLIGAAHAAGTDGSAPMLAVPRHDSTPSENVARRLYQAGATEAARLDRSDA